MTVRRLGIALALGAALTAASCSSDAGEPADSGAASSAVDGAGDPGASGDTGASGDPVSDTTDASPQDLLLTPEEAAPMPMTVADPAIVAQAGAGIELPELGDLQVEPPECADATDLSATLSADITDGGLAALMGGGEDASAMYTVQVLRTSLSLDDYEENWENCSDVRFSGQALNMSGSSTSVDAPDVEGADDVVARTSETQVEALGPGGRMTSLAYLTEVRGVKVIAGAITMPDAGGELGPETEAALTDLLTRQVAKITEAG